MTPMNLGKIWGWMYLLLGCNFHWGRPRPFLWASAGSHGGACRPPCVHSNAGWHSGRPEGLCNSRSRFPDTSSTPPHAALSRSRLLHKERTCIPQGGQDIGGATAEGSFLKSLHPIIIIHLGRGICGRLTIEERASLWPCFQLWIVCIIHKCISRNSGLYR